MLPKPPLKQAYILLTRAGCVSAVRGTTTT